jgi:tRNA U34 5-methylaminomethyl-2-thiouridine-forming methyltransferase MnmC
MPPLHLTPTGDGSLTVHSDEYEQAMHTLSGAREESLLKHVIPSRVLERDGPVLHVLDVGFGIGYNVLVLLEEFLTNRKGRRLEVVSLEKEAPPPEMLKSIDFPGAKGEF